MQENGGAGEAPERATADTAPLPEVEALDGRRVAVRAGRHASRAGLSVPGAVLGALVIAASALGAAGVLSRPSDAGHRPHPVAEATKAAGEAGDHADAKHDEDPGPMPAPTSAPEGDRTTGGPTDAPDPDPTAKPQAGATAKPDAKPDPTPKPEPKPDPTKPPAEPIALSVGLKKGHPVLEWSACEGVTFDKYKVVRSTNDSVTWPTGAGDELFAAVGADDSRWAWDASSPTGTRLYYRVFCVRATDAGYVVKAASKVRSIDVPPAPEPVDPPDPVQLGFEAGATEGGSVALSWDACDVEGFVYYKVVRSTTMDDPSYLPWTDGTELIAVLGDPVETTWVDEDLGAGETAWYRIQCLGWFGDEKIVLGQTEVLAVTMP